MQPQFTPQLARHGNASHDRLLRWGIGALASVWALTSSAEGFRNPPAGAFGLGRAGGRIAQVDDASAVTHNPANLLDVPEAEVEFSPTVANLRWRFNSSTVAGQNAATTDTWKLLPDLFASMPLKQDQVALGLGVTTPYGIGSQWDVGSSAFAQPTSLLRYQAANAAELTTINFNPAVAVRVTDQLHLGIGLDVMWSDLTLNQFYPWLVFPGSLGTEPDGAAKAKGDGVGYGGNLGLTWLITPRQRIAVTFRSPMDVDYRGDFTINNITPTAAFLGATPRSGFNSKIRFPTIVALGYGIQLSDTIRLETDLEWIQFSRFKSLDLSFANNALLFPSASIPQNWRDTFTAGIGGDWRFAPHWIARASYQYYQSPIPDSTLSPTLVDGNQNVITSALGYVRDHHKLELAYSRVLYDRRHVVNSYNPAFNGNYSVDLDLFSFAYRYDF